MKTLKDGYIIRKKDLYDYLTRNMVCNHIVDEKVNQLINNAYRYYDYDEPYSTKKEKERTTVDNLYDELICHDDIDTAVEKLNEYYDTLLIIPDYINS